MTNYPLFIGWRYAGSKRRDQLVSFISLIAMLGLALGVALLIVVLSVMNGFDYEMRHRILALAPHITVSTYINQSSQQQSADQQQYIEQLITQHDEVVGVAPLLQRHALLIRGATAEPVLIVGIDATREPAVSIIDQFLSPQALVALAAGDIIVGAALAKRLAITVGDRLTVMAPEASDTNQYDITPHFNRFTVGGLLDTGTELDQSLVLLSIDSARSLGGEQQAGWRLRVADIFAAPQIAFDIGQSLPHGYQARDWTYHHGNLYAAIQMSRRLVALMLLSIIAVAAFNVISALVMVVNDKAGDIAMLRSLGASSRGIVAIFIVQGSLIGVIGVLTGIVLGCGLSLSVSDAVLLLERWLGLHFLHSDVYPIDYLPSQLRLEDVLLVGGTALAMSILASLYPAWRAARVQPAEALRYE